MLESIVGWQKKPPAIRKFNVFVVCSVAVLLLNAHHTNASEFDCDISASRNDADGYYDNVASANGQTLRRNLSALISAKAKKLRYSEVWNALEITDADPCTPDRVILLYTGRSHPAADRTSGGRGQNDTWNREHVWPKSHGFRRERIPAYTDIHHLRPADKTVNSSRGHKDFGDGGKPHREAPDTFTTKHTWEPRDLVKGDIARMMFYMEVRYANDPNVPQLRLMKTDTDSNQPRLGLLCTLYAWHHEDPVNNWELRRNGLIEIEQGNRNPFIDHPEWVEVIWGQDCTED